MKSRNLSFDIVRIMACSMVVLMHSPMPSPDAVGPFLTALSYFTAPCIGLFFMVSGALLLPIKTDYYTFIRKRFSRIIIPTIVWSVVYIALKLYYSESEINILRTLASIPFSAQGEGVLWFMYTLAGLYLLAPILSAWCEKATKSELEIVLALWGMTLCYPILNLWLFTNASTTGILYYFTGYAGYFLLGYYLKTYPRAISSFLCYSVAMAGIVLLVLLKHYRVQFDFYSLFWYESIFIVALAAAIWKTIVKYSGRFNMSMNDKTTPQFSGGGIYLVISKLSNLTFGVYLIHVLILRRWLWRWNWICELSDYPLQCIIIALMTMLLSVIACILISRMPLSEWIIGYHHKSPGSTT